jgi:glutathione S-transferase
MKYYRSQGPNPAVTDAYLAQRGITLETVDIDLFTGENRQPTYMALNREAKLPLLVLDDGTKLAETVAICEYLDETMPGASLIGDTPEARAVTRMWIRRLDFNIIQPLSKGWQYAEGLEFCKHVMYVIPHAADDLKAITVQGLQQLDADMGENRFICGKTLTLADIMLYVFVEFRANSGLPLDPQWRWLHAWRDRMTAQTFASAVRLQPAA